MKKFLLAALAAVSIPSMAAAQKVDVDPAVWVVKDADTTIYMFGTFHMLDSKSDWFNDEVKTAFDASDELVLEAVSPDDPAEMQKMMQGLVMKYGVDPAGKPLSGKLPEPVKAKYEKELTSMGVPVQNFEPLEPWAVSLILGTVSMQKIGLTGEYGPEAALAKAAKAKGMRVSELEGYEWQLAMMDKMSPEMQVEMLSSAVDAVKTIGDTIKPLVTAWSTGDNEGFAKIQNQSAQESPAFYDIMYSNRNATWADWIGKRLDKPGTVFMAVGAGHLGGKNSVQELLAKRGIKAERVKS